MNRNILYIYQLFQIYTAIFSFSTAIYTAIYTAIIQQTKQIFLSFSMFSTFGNNWVPTGCRLGAFLPPIVSITTIPLYSQKKRPSIHIESKGNFSIYFFSSGRSMQ